MRLEQESLWCMWHLRCASMLSGARLVFRGRTQCLEAWGTTPYMSIIGSHPSSGKFWPFRDPLIKCDRSKALLLGSLYGMSVSHLYLFERVYGAVEACVFFDEIVILWVYNATFAHSKPWGKCGEMQQQQKSFELNIDWPVDEPNNAIRWILNWNLLVPCASRYYCCGPVVCRPHERNNSLKQLQTWECSVRIEISSIQVESKYVLIIYGKHTWQIRGVSKCRSFCRLASWPNARSDVQNRLFASGSCLFLRRQEQGSVGEDHPRCWRSVHSHETSWRFAHTC